MMKDVVKVTMDLKIEENDNKTVLKELTKTPVASLTKEEQYRLELGIGIVGEEALISALEDYGS